MYFQQTHEDLAINQPENQQINWMQVAGLNFTSTNSTENRYADIFLNDSNAAYSPELVSTMPFWIERAKANCLDLEDAPGTCQVDQTTLNQAQRFAYDVVSTHFNGSVLQPLFMMVTGQAGSGKSYLISAIKNRLGDCCAITSCFGIAAFNVKGQTLHSKFQLPIRGKKNHDLKVQALVHLQEMLSSIKYVIIDEFSVMGQTMFGWIDRRCRQGTGNMSQFFGSVVVW